MRDRREGKADQGILAAMKIGRDAQIFGLVVATIVCAGLYWSGKYLSTILSLPVFLAICVTWGLCMLALAWWLDKKMAKAKSERSDEP